MNSTFNPYLSFRDQAREALSFYQGILGGTVTLSTFGDGQVTQDPAEKDKIMHGVLETEKGVLLMAADTPNSMAYTAESNISLSLSGDDAAELTGYYNNLLIGGKVSQPLTQAPWGDTFGMLTDQFGVFWMINITAKKG